MAVHMMQSTKPKIQKHYVLTPWIHQPLSGLLGESNSLSLARLCNLGLAAILTSLNSYSSEAECIHKYFPGLGLKKVEGTTGGFVC